MLRRRVLKALVAESEIEFEQLRLKFPEAKVRGLREALYKLSEEGLIEMHLPGKYRCVKGAFNSSQAASSSVSPSSFIQRPSKARLMGSR